MLLLTSGGAFACFNRSDATNRLAHPLWLRSEHAFGPALQYMSGGSDLRRIVFAPPDGQMKTRKDFSIASTHPD